MKKHIFLLLLLFSGMVAGAQFRGASLQASGLTCSMCSKAVKNALDKVPFVSKVMVNIKNQEYMISFAEGAEPDFDALSKAVEDAGFSVASLKVTADVPAGGLQKDQHLQIGKQYFHFLNSAKQTDAGTVTFSLVDRNFVSAKEYKKCSGLSKMSCVQTGKTADCCTKMDVPAEARVYHVLL